MLADVHAETAQLETPSLNVMQGCMYFTILLPPGRVSPNDSRALTIVVSRIRVYNRGRGYVIAF